MSTLPALRPLTAALVAALSGQAHAADAFQDLGQGLAGSVGTPALVGSGTLIGGTTYTLSLTGAAPHSQAWLVFGQSALNLPLAGGTLVPAPDAVAGPLDTGAAGALEGTFTWPVGLAPGRDDYWQVWLVDPAAPGGLAASNALASTTPPQVGGTFPDDWIHGGNCADDPSIQVHRYNEDTWILRQSMCTNFEGPFMYLLFGEDRVLLEDTGAGGIPIAETVYAIIDQWLLERGQASIELIVTHSHGHGDHVQGDVQFAGQPNTTLVGYQTNDVASFYGIADPSQIVTYDLGGRILDVVAIPGHQAAHIAFYDRNTGLLLTGDSLYPGFIFLQASTWNTFRDSISRLRDFVQDQPVAWILGTHIEMKSTPFEAYPYGTNNQPEERDLQLEKRHLEELDDALDQLPTATTEIHADFIING